MKSFKQYLNEAKIDREYSHSTEIRFDSLGSGFHCDINPFAGRGYLLSDNDLDSYSHEFSIGVFSSGSVEYYRNPTNEELDVLKKVRSGEITDPKKRPSYIITQEMKKVMNTEILKAANEFDKKVEAILKKHGFVKGKK